MRKKRLYLLIAGIFLHVAGNLCGQTNNQQNTISNNSFETPSFINGSFAYNPVDSSWVFHLSGIATNGCGFNNPPAPTGTQALFIQERSYASQTINFSSGSYKIGFKAANRDGFGIQTFKIYIDSLEVGNYTVSNVSYQLFSTDSFRVTAGNHVLSIVGQNTQDNTAFIDDINIEVVDNEQPSKPSALTVSGLTPTSFLLSWAASTDNIGVSLYEVYSNGALLGTTSSNSLQVNNLTCAATYSITVKAQDAAGNTSENSDTLDVRTIACNLPVNKISNSSFENPAFPAGSFAYNPTDSYWQYNKSGIVANGAGFGNPAATTGTQALFIQERSSATQYINFTAGTYTITFNAANRNGFGTQTIKVLVGTTEIGTFTINNSGYQTFTTDTFTVETDYLPIVIAGQNIEDNTAFIDDIRIVIPDHTAPSAPVELTPSQISQTGFNVAWTASTDNVAVVSYNIYDGAELVGNTESTTFQMDNLNCGTLHKITVKALDEAGNISTPSDTLTVNTTACVQSNNLVNQSSFESPVLNERTYLYTPTENEWTFSSSSGLITNGCAFGNPNSPTGNQAAFVQSRGTLSQNINFSAGTYIMTFMAACRQNFATQSVTIKIGSTVIGEYTFTNNNYQYFATSTFTVPAGAQLLTISGLVNEDATVFIDDICIDHPDVSAPTKPEGLNITNLEQTALTLTWTPSTDNRAVIGYDIYKNGSLTGSIVSNSINITGLTDSTSYTFTVIAKDLAGNYSPTSEPLQTQTPAWPSYKIGTNFWNPGWGIWDDCFQQNIDWTTTTNPWHPQFLQDLATYNGPIRFMDWCGANNPNSTTWATRTQKRADQHNAIVNNRDIAWEWMIDLCNRTNHDMWINVPYLTQPEYWSQLATLIKDNLNPNLKVYVEYSNETWNGGMMSFGHVINQGVALGIPPTDNMWYQGGAFSVYQAANIWNSFQNIFGAEAMGTRVIRTYAFSGNFDIAERAYINIIQNGGTTWNPGNQTADIFAIAPYIGPYDDALGSTTVIDGGAANIAERFRANVDWNFTNYITPAVNIAKKYNKPICTYEAGQQLNTNAGAWSANQAIYDEYIYMFNKWKAAKFQFVINYTHTGNYYPGGAWGAKPYINATLADSPKYRAIVNWLSANDNTPAFIRSSEKAAITDIYPNPATSIVNISFEKFAVNNIKTVTITDLTGKIVFKNSITDNLILHLDVSGIERGVYIVSISDGVSRTNSKLVLN